MASTGIAEIDKEKYSKEQLELLIDKKAYRVAVMMFYISATLYPFWSIIDYFFAQDRFFEFLSIRLLISIIFFTTTYLFRKRKLSYRTTLHINFTSVILSVSYFISQAQVDALLPYFLTYIAVICVGYFFLVLRPLEILYFFVLIVVSLLLFNELSQDYIIELLMIKGGYLFLSVLLFAMGGSYVHYLNTRRDAIKSFKLKKANKQLQEQKEELFYINKEITDSINYAKRIQEAMLSYHQTYEKIPEHFILFRPKDIVSGDFYWFKILDGYFYAAVGDCTGHGVPGGFMSMLSIGLLNNVVENNELTAAEVLNLLRKRLVENLHSGTDGLDISFCKINLKTRELNWAGANNPLYIYREEDDFNHFDERTDKLGILLPDDEPIGYSKTMKPFTDKYLKLYPTDEIFIFSDGYADQFGGPRNKKFKYQRMKKEFIRIYPLSMEEQRKELEQVYEKWKGDFPQVDDVCIVGIKCTNLNHSL